MCDKHSYAHRYTFSRRASPERQSLGPKPDRFRVFRRRMAALVSVKGEPDPIKKHVAARLVNRGLAAWVQRGISIRRLTDRQRTLRSYCKKHASGFVPEKLPLAELPGLIFELPERPPKFPFPVFEDLPAISE